MALDLLHYMSERHPRSTREHKDPGPVITISREYGCPANEIARKLVEAINNKAYIKGARVNWKWVSKEILFESAKKLELEPQYIEYVFNREEKSIIDDIITSHKNRYYKSDRRIRNTIGRVIRNIAEAGQVIIVGRGGVAIAKDIPASLHVHLEAPLEWRALRGSEKHNIPVEEARKCAVQVDINRKEFREYYQGKNSDYTRFDATFNCMTLSIDEIVSILLKMSEIRKLV